MPTRNIWAAFLLLISNLQVACGSDDSGGGSGAMVASELTITSFCGGSSCSLRAVGRLSDAGADPAVWGLYLTYAPSSSPPATCADELLQGYLLKPGEEYVLNGTFAAGEKYTFKVCALNIPENLLSPHDLGLVREIALP